MVIFLYKVVKNLYSFGQKLVTYIIEIVIEKF